ncbi:MAG: hypothetical protein OEO20_13925 [Gemmatimonadota bacterium]|nr:hypothetical protein [Gemmatimonadota bacterium]MDH3479390.1 hypothetical protein [Gemmatimonadota bacterium]MDH3569640.1 hypothetical protein [Gemmatimonadota bacterium]MDH5548902.1 hypothetical protein [Gemmatimonadota bacterium]
MLEIRTASTRLRCLVPLAVLCLLTGVWSCAPGGAQRVSPEEIPDLEDQLATRPQDGAALLRYAAALYAADRCDTATVVARAGMVREPAQALGPLVLGHCLERAQEYDQALTVYASYLEAQPDRAGSSSVRARQSIARRDRALANARRALDREAELAQTPSDPATVAVLPIDIVGDSTYRPLSLGLAQILTTDLALLQRFTMVERLQIGVLVEEIRVADTGRIDPATAARVGHLVRAGRLVQGLVTIPPRGTTRMEANVVLGTGEVTAPARQAGKLRDLLKMEKQLVVDIARQLGYQLSQAELRLILENGTQNLAAFMAYSQGLDAEDRGDYRSAALYYARAVRADPNFRAAREGYEAAVAGQQAVDAPSAAITQLATVPTPAPDQLVVGTQGSALTTTILDVAGTQAEVTAPTITPTNTGTNTTSSSPPPTVRVLGTPPTASGSVRIFFRLP